MKSRLVESIINSPDFNEHFYSLLNFNVSCQFSETFELDNESDFNIKYLLKCADVLSLSDAQLDLDKALRICQTTLSSEIFSQLEKEKSAYILKKLGNYPLLDLADRKGKYKMNSRDEISTGEILINSRIDKQFTNHLSNGSEFKVNSFQRDFWDKAEDNEIVSVSAPTAAGKSFIFCKYILESLLKEKKINILYLVPTRALVTQVSQDIDDTLKENIDNYKIITLPNSDFFEDADKKIFVFTQERLHFLLSKHYEKFDYIYVDEAHKLSDSYRGILLQHAILRASCNDSKVIYASPFSSNPEKLLELHGSYKIKGSVYTPVATVNQNLFWVSQKAKRPKKWDVSHISEREINIGELTLDNNPNSQIKRLAFISYKIGQVNCGNLVYVNIPSDAEKVCGLIIDQMKNDNVQKKKSQELDDLIELCEKTVHKSFLLTTYLKYGVAFHYGNIPQIIRNKIENLFKSGEISYLICTSTLVEGVNLSCKNIFVRGPKKGRRQNMAMTNEDFWNLAGRAGRWGLEFQGNIFCIDVDDERIWPNGKPKERKPYVIKPSVEKQLKNIDEIIDYIKRGTPRDESLNNITFEYLISYIIEGISDEDNLILDSIGDSSKSKELILNVNDMLRSCTLPYSIFKNNPGISPIAIETLYKYFLDKCQKGELESIIPPHPSSEGAVIDLVKVLSRINKYLSPSAFGYNSAATFVLSLLITKWMNGYTVARLISDREKYLKKKKGTINISSVIRSVLDDIENIARFRAPKYLSCYNDVLRHVLTSEGKLDLIEHLGDMQLSLEFGVNIKTQLSLISLGLSRTTAIEISNYISSSNLNPKDVLRWLENNDITKFDLPNMVKLEIIELLNKS